MRVTAYTNRKFMNCDEVENYYKNAKLNCLKSSFVNESGQKVDTFCGCGDI